MNHPEAKNENTLSTRSMDVVVAILLMIVAAVVMVDNWRIGARWASDGPQSGYFPFYIGLIMFVSSGTTLALSLLGRQPNLENFVERSQLKSVLLVLVPTIVYVILIDFIGIYVASAFFIAFFMWWLGKYRLHVILPVAVLVPLGIFFMFEVWFLVPLPKGPLEAALGY